MPRKRNSAARAGLWLMWVATAGALAAAESRPRSQGHAHNDYEHSRPLLDALSHGFASVEADVYLVDGQLLVAHEPADVRPGRTLEALYLEPLRERVRQNDGAVKPGGRNRKGDFFLLVDIKTEAEPTYQALAERLKRYQSMLTRFTANQIVTGAVTIVLSGNRPRQTVAAQAERWVAIDGRLPDLEGNAPVSLVPLISDNWRLHFRWNGEGTISNEEKQTLVGFVRRAHDQHRRLRFWAIPDRPEGWKVLREAGVDFINTDKLAELETFLGAQAE